MLLPLNWNSMFSLFGNSIYLKCRIYTPSACIWAYIGIHVSYVCVCMVCTCIVVILYVCMYNINFPMCLTYVCVCVEHTCIFVIFYVCTMFNVFFQLQSTIVDMLKQTSTHRFLSSECIRLYLILPAFILQPLNIKLFSAFAHNVTCLAAEWKALVGKNCVYMYM